MNIVIYESSSRGGNYNYAQSLFKAYRSHSKVNSVELLLPSNAPLNPENNIKINLLSDRISGSVIVNKLKFIVRTLVNPFILFLHLLRKGKALVIFNDFEQLTAPLWVPFFRLFLTKHRFAVFLHDPDRDRYPPSFIYAKFSMKTMMRLMHLGLYHDHLPAKPYYRNLNTRFVSVPHGIYGLPSENDELLTKLLDFKKSNHLFSIIGNIRKEKNYEIAIRALRDFPQARMIIAGKQANDNIQISELKKEAEINGVSDRIQWLIKYLDESELSAVIRASDCILLNYASTFASQSGIINMIAPFRKNIIVSDTASGMTHIARRFNLGIIIPADDREALSVAMKEVMSNNGKNSQAWTSFIQQASWTRQVDVVADIYESL